MITVGTEVMVGVLDDRMFGVVHNRPATGWPRPAKAARPAPGLNAAGSGRLGVRVVVVRRSPGSAGVPVPGSRIGQRAASGVTRAASRWFACPWRAGFFTFPG
jgi:hypothetical protein